MGLVLSEPRALLGDAVHTRFGAEFSKSFDFLDTLGAALSLQVHPLTEYIQDKFCMK
jgi:mannose-6-phosphate isomerase